MYEEINRLLQQALAFQESEDYELAEKLFLEALYKLDDKEHQLYQTIVYGLGMNYIRQGNLEGAKGCFEEGRSNAHQAQNIPFEMDMLHQLVLLTRQIGDFEGAELLFEEELLFREQFAQTDYEGKAACYYEGSLIALELDKFLAAEEHLQQALNYADLAEDIDNKALILMKLGDYFEKKGFIEKAEKAYREALPLAETAGNTKNAAGIQLRLDAIHSGEQK